MAGEPGRVVGQHERARGERLVAHLAGAVVALRELGDAPAVAVVAGGRPMLGQRHRQRQPDVAEPDHRNPLVAHRSSPARMNTPSTCSCRASLRSK